MPEDPIPIELRTEGTIRFSVGAKRVTLRRPNVGEWEQLYEAWFVMGEDIADESDKVQEQSEGLPNASPSEKRASNKVRRQLLHDLRQTRQTESKRWMRLCIDLLADTQVEDDDFEAWMLTEVCVNTIATHFQQFPLARGDGA